MVLKPIKPTTKKTTVKKPTSTLKNRTKEKGQLALEAIMIVMLLVSLSLVASREIRRRNLMGKIVSGPWRDISGMMSTGNWQSSQSAMDENLHPHVNTMTREGD